MSTEKLPAFLILAAGSSSRMGSPKQLLPWKNSTLIGNAIALVKSFTDEFIVVLGANHERISTHIERDKFVINDNWSKGMGNSLRHGIQQLNNRYSPNAILVLLVDQPLLQREHYKALITQYYKTPNRICASNYGDRAGVPAIFPKQCLKPLLDLNADYGARKILKENAVSVITINTRGQLVDLDTKEDYESAFARWGTLGDVDSSNS